MATSTSTVTANQLLGDTAKNPMSYEQWAQWVGGDYKKANPMQYVSAEQPFQYSAQQLQDTGLTADQYGSYARKWFVDQENEKIKDPAYVALGASPEPQYLPTPDIATGVGMLQRGTDASGAQIWEQAPAQPVRAADLMSSTTSASPAPSMDTAAGRGVSPDAASTSTVTANDLMNRKSYDPSQYDPRMTDEQLLQLWQGAPGIENVAGGKYYDAQGGLYRYNGNSYWQTNDGKWHMGNPDGTITDVAAPSWSSASGSPTGGNAGGNGNQGNSGANQNQGNQGNQAQSYTYDQLKGMTDAQRLAYWSKLPGIENVKDSTYYDASGKPYAYIGDGYWQDAKDGKWYKGSLNGTVSEVGDKAPWEAQSGASQPTTFKQLLQKYYDQMFGGGGNNAMNTASNAQNVQQRQSIQNSIDQITAANPNLMSTVQSIFEGVDQNDPAAMTAAYQKLQASGIDMNAFQQLTTLNQQLTTLQNAGSAGGGNGGSMQPGALTLAAMLSQPEAKSWVKPGTPLGAGYGQVGYGGQNLVYNPYYKQ